MKKLTTLLIFSSLSLFAQQRIDNTFAFQTDPAKKYSIYVPSGYVAGTPHKMMLGLHPFNTNRWDAESWCDTLIDFAEANNLLLVCPDGGSDGRVDDAIDTAFTSALLDSMETWYSVDLDKVYIMGFSWGGKTTYSYGLNRPNQFGGYIPIGAAVNGAGEIAPYAANASNQAFYVVHGANDAQAIRYTPLINSLNTNGAILNSLLMPGVGHTIDFANRNQILTDAYEWVDSVNCYQLASISIQEYSDYTDFELFPNPVKKGNSIRIDISKFNGRSIPIQVLDINGRQVYQTTLLKHSNYHVSELSIDSLDSGSYILLINDGNQKSKARLIIE